MTEQSGEATKVAAICTDCERAFAAEVSPDDTVRLIGQPGGCRCGGTEFEVPTETRRVSSVGTADAERAPEE